MDPEDSGIVMTRRAADSSDDATGRELRLDRLLGRQVRTIDDRPMGRLEEFRVDKNERELTITEYVIGAAGLFERLGVGVRLLLGQHVGGYVARWDQFDVTNADRPRLTCAIEDLRRL